MTNALTVYESGNFELMQRTAQAMVTSGFFKDTRDLSQAIVKVMAGAELGLPPFASMTGINIIQGKPALGSNVIATLVKNSGRYDYRIKQCDEKAAVLTWYENGQAIGESAFNIEEANRAGLTGKDNWKKYPSDMLFARAVSRGARRFAPGIFGGSPVYTPDELGADVDPDGYIDGETVQTPFHDDDMEEAANDFIGDIDAEAEQDEPEANPDYRAMLETVSNPTIGLVCDYAHQVNGYFNAPQHAMNALNSWDGMNGKKPKMTQKLTNETAVKMFDWLIDYKKANATDENGIPYTTDANGVRNYHGKAARKAMDNDLKSLDSKHSE